MPSATLPGDEGFVGFRKISLLDEARPPIGIIQNAGLPNPPPK
jgi:hypothetical protein